MTPYETENKDIILYDKYSITTLAIGFNFKCSINLLNAFSSGVYDIFIHVNYVVSKELLKEY